MLGGILATVIEVQKRGSRDPLVRIEILVNRTTGFLDTKTIYTVGRELWVTPLGGNLFRICEPAGLE